MNGSTIYLLDLEEQVSDLEYSRCGWIQVTGVFVDEESEITEGKSHYISFEVIFR